MNIGDRVPIKGADLPSALVSVVEISDVSQTNFKRLQLRSETGYSMKRFAVNIFEGHPLYTTIAVGDKLRVTVCIAVNINISNFEL